MSGAYQYQVTVPGIAIPYIEISKARREPVAFSFTGGTIVLDGGVWILETGNEPVYIWYAPDRQCVKRVTSRDIHVIQPGEDLWFAFDFGGVLDNNNSSIAEILYVQDTLSFLVPGSESIAGTEVRFRLVAPTGAIEQDGSIEVSIQDTKNNVHISDGILRVRKGPA